MVADKLHILDGYSVKYISYGSLDKHWILRPTEHSLSYDPINITNKSYILLQKVECLDYTFYIIKDRELYTWRIKYPLGSSSYKSMTKSAREAILYLCLFLMETGDSSFYTVTSVSIIISLYVCCWVLFSPLGTARVLWEEESLTETCLCKTGRSVGEFVGHLSRLIIDVGRCSLLWNISLTM